VIDVALYESVFNCMERLVPEYSALGVVREPAGSALPGIAPSNAYRCTDGWALVLPDGRLRAAVRTRVSGRHTRLRAGREVHVQSLPREAMTQYTVALMAPAILSLLTGLSGRTRPVFNITISNVPGPDNALYFRGAELLGAHPAPIVLTARR
jgi:hypothetical protein